jgi:preprotein translocase subunit SecG
VDIIVVIIKGIHIIVSILLIITVLLQPGKGDDLGTMFGGTSQSIFGASGAVPFLTKVTRFLAVLFILTSLSLGYFSAKGVKSSVVKDVGVEDSAAVVNKEDLSTTEGRPDAGLPGEKESKPASGEEAK